MEMYRAPGIARLTHTCAPDTVTSQEPPMHAAARPPKSVKLPLLARHEVIGRLRLPRSASRLVAIDPVEVAAGDSRFEVDASEKSVEL